jgi:hypothetical protein
MHFQAAQDIVRRLRAAGVESPPSPPLPHQHRLFAAVAGLAKVVGVHDLEWHPRAAATVPQPLTQRPTRTRLPSGPNRDAHDDEDDEEAESGGGSEAEEEGFHAARPQRRRKAQGEPDAEDEPADQGLTRRTNMASAKRQRVVNVDGARRDRQVAPPMADRIAEPVNEAARRPPPEDVNALAVHVLSPEACILACAVVERAQQSRRKPSWFPRSTEGVRAASDQTAPSSAELGHITGILTTLNDLRGRSDVVRLTIRVLQHRLFAAYSVDSTLEGEARKAGEPALKKFRYHVRQGDKIDKACGGHRGLIPFIPLRSSVLPAAAQLLRLRDADYCAQVGALLAGPRVTSLCTVGQQIIDVVLGGRAGSDLAGLMARRNTPGGPDSYMPLVSPCTCPAH